MLPSTFNLCAHQTKKSPRIFSSEPPPSPSARKILKVGCSLLKRTGGRQSHKFAPPAYHSARPLGLAAENYVPPQQRPCSLHIQLHCRWNAKNDNVISGGNLFGRELKETKPGEPVPPLYPKGELLRGLAGPLICTKPSRLVACPRASRRERFEFRTASCENLKAVPWSHA